MTGPTDRLLRRTRRRLFATTLGLLALLVVAVGTATALAGLNALDADVDQALRGAVSHEVETLDGGLPGASEEGEADEQLPESADTFLLVLDADGGVVANLSRVALTGMPDLGAVPGAARGEDLRTVTAGGLAVRLLTMPVVHDGRVRGYVQGGFILTLHDRQSQSLVLAIALVGAAGLVGAAVVTLLVTDRALAPIRRTFETQRQFVADASHELRTPAALIRANAEVLEREGLVAADGRPLLEDVMAEADRLGGLVGDLLQLAAWDGRRPEIRPVPLDVAEVAAATVRGALALAGSRRVELVVEAGAPAWARADRDRLVQVLLVLLDNAIDHSPEGGRVTVRARATPGRPVEIEVDDAGPGIPTADRERIFEPFTRLAGAGRRAPGGTGLGLAIARRIVEAHGGTIAAGTPPGGGARFTVTLPAAPPGEPAVPPIGHEGPPTAGTR